MKKIIILGGGFCGSLIAKHFDSDDRFKVTLIDREEYFEYSPGLIKLLSKPDYHEKIKKNYDDFLKNTTKLEENVKKVTPKFVQTDKNTYEFDILVISSGIEYPIFLKNKTDVFTIKSGKKVKSFYSKVANAKKIIIIGGGLIGTEAAGEIATQFPEKKIVIVHSKDRLIERNPTSASDYAKKILEERGVKIIFNQRIKKHKNNLYFTDNNKQIKADLGIWSAGIKHNPYYMEEFNSNVFSDDNALNVNEFLQLKGYENIFVGGDITSINEEKTAQNADRHALKIISNINRLVKRKKLSIYKKRPPLLLLSLGRNDGLLTLPNFTIPGFIPSIFKWLVEKFSLIRL